MVDSAGRRESHTGPGAGYPTYVGTSSAVDKRESLAISKESIRDLVADNAAQITR